MDVISTYRQRPKGKGRCGRGGSRYEAQEVAAILAVMALAVAAPSASAVGGPNEAGKSGHFHPNSGPCDGKADHPHSPGPH